MGCSPPGSSIHRDSPGRNTGMGCYVLLHGIFPTQRSSPGLPHCRRILYHLSHQGSPTGNYIPTVVMSKGDLEHRHQQNQIPYTNSVRLVLPQDRNGKSALILLLSPSSSSLKPMPAFQSCSSEYWQKDSSHCAHLLSINVN